MEPLPDDYLVDTVLVENRAGVDEYGTPTFDAPVSYPKSRVIWRSRSVMSATGQLIHSRGQVLITGSPVPTITVDDRITLPNGDKPLIIESSLLRDRDGTPHHASVLFG